MTVRNSPAAPTVQSGNGNRTWLSKTWLWLLAILGFVLLVLFIQSFQPGEVLFANDVTLGQMKAPPNRLPGALAGKWLSGVWVGIDGVAVAPTITALLTMATTPELFLKIYAPFTMLFVGFCAWVFFRQLEFNPWVCLLGGLAAGLNMHFFSIACWGLGNWNIASGMVFLSLAALRAKSIPQLWARGVLAGLALGMNLMEGFDVGAIQCLFVGAFIVWQLFTDETPGPKRFVKVFCTEALVIAFSAFIAAHSITSLVSTQVEGVVGTGQDEQTKEERWDPATRWSLPKAETLQVIMPGLFGYRMMAKINVPDKSSAYWGTVGRDPRLEYLMSADPVRRTKAMDSLSLPTQVRADFESEDRQKRENALSVMLSKSPSVGRFSGSEEYAGVLVALLACFALANSLRGAAAPYSIVERRSVWFWGAAALFSLVAAWGRYAFFYRLLYQLPYLSTIRNPIKFMHPFHLAWLILAGYGLEALWRRYVRQSVARTGFEKGWMAVSVALVVAVLVALPVYDHWKPKLVSYMVQEGFDAAKAIQMAGFSSAEAGWFAFWLFLSATVLLIIMSGAWSGPRARLAGIALGLIIIVDLARSDIPWIHYFNYEKEYASNSLLDVLQDKPYEHRVTGRLSPKGLGSSVASQIGRLYNYWQQNDFPYHGIQSLDFAQWPRTPELDAAYMKNFGLHGNSLADCDMWPTERLWELTSTRYIFYANSLATALKSRADSNHGVRVNTFLSVIPKPGVSFIEDAGDLTAVADPKGAYALLEFTNPLPRAALYADWQTPTNDDAALRTLLSRDFDPHRTVLVASNTPVGQAPSNPQAVPGTVSITDFRPKRVTLQAHAAAPAVLMLNDRITPEWGVSVDHKPAPLLRCNYLMRGVFLTPGDHTVEFRYKPDLLTLSLSLAGWGVGLLTAGFLVFSRKSAPQSVAARASVPATPPVPAAAAPVQQKQKSQPAPVTASAPPPQKRGGKQKGRR